MSSIPNALEVVSVLIIILLLYRLCFKGLKLNSLKLRVNKLLSIQINKIYFTVNDQNFKYNLKNSLYSFAFFSVLIFRNKIRYFSGAVRLQLLY